MTTEADAVELAPQLPATSTTETAPPVPPHRRRRRRPTTMPTAG